MKNEATQATAENIKMFKKIARADFQPFLTDKKPTKKAVFYHNFSHLITITEILEYDEAGNQILNETNVLIYIGRKGQKIEPAQPTDFEVLNTSEETETSEPQGEKSSDLEIIRPEVYELTASDLDRLQLKLYHGRIIDNNGYYITNAILKT